MIYKKNIVHPCCYLFRNQEKGDMKQWTELCVLGLAPDKDRASDQLPVFADRRRRVKSGSAPLRWALTTKRLNWKHCTVAISPASPWHRQSVCVWVHACVYELVGGVCVCVSVCVVLSVCPITVTEYISTLNASTRQWCWTERAHLYTCVLLVTIWRVRPRSWWCWTPGAERRSPTLLLRSATSRKRRRRVRCLQAPPLVWVRRRRRVHVHLGGAAVCQFWPHPHRRLPRHPCWARPTGPPRASAARSELWGPVVCEEGGDHE